MTLNWEAEVRRYREIPGLIPKSIHLSEERGEVLASFTCGILPEKAHEDALCRVLRGFFPSARLTVRLSCPGLCAAFMQEPQTYGPAILERDAGELAGVIPFLRDAEWSAPGHGITLTLARNVGLDLLTERCFPVWLEGRLHALFGAAIPVRLIAPDDLEENLERVAGEARREEERLLAAIRTTSHELENRPRALIGKLFSGRPVPMGDLLEDSGRVTVAGEVLGIEVREVKSGKSKLLTLDVTDYTGTVTLKAFLPAEQPPVKLARGDGVMARGEYQLDAFSKEYVLRVVDLITHALARRMDEAPEGEQRVELHCHTRMSPMDGVTPIDALIRRAAQWGHPAVAVTDHGCTQAFPDAFGEAKKAGIKLIPGMEGYLVDDGRSIVSGGAGLPLDQGVVVLDIETTGLSPVFDRITEIGAVRIRGGRIDGEYKTFVNPGRAIPTEITELTGITDAMVRDAPSEAEGVAGLLDFIGSDAAAAHNADFDISFIRRVALDLAREIPRTVIDTVALAQVLLPELSNHKLHTVCRRLGIKNERHHRAVQDARATAEAYIALRAMAQDQGVATLDGLNTSGVADRRLRSGKSHHIIILARDHEGLVRLNRCVSEGYLRFYQPFPPQPRIPRSRLAALREGLILGSACADGELIAAMLDGADDDRLERIARFYDFLEIQPIENNRYLVRAGMAADEEALRGINRRIVALGHKLGIPVCATGDVHFLDPRDAVFREIIMTSEGFSDAHLQAPLYLRTTAEMLEEFAYLGEEEARRVVVEAPRAIADTVRPMPLFPVHPQGLPTFQPTLEGAEGRVEERARARAQALYGEELPSAVAQRLDRELGAIIANGFATLYDAARQLVQRSLSEGYLVGSRGSVGSSLVAYLLDVTEINPLAPHYRCPNCRFSDFGTDAIAYPCGVDLPARNCPRCGTALCSEGFDIAFEVFLGFDADKVPDIDLNFSGEYQTQAMAVVEELFGGSNCYRAGTISTLAEKTAYGCVMKWAEKYGKRLSRAEVARLADGIVGVKKTTGQHPGGMVIVPNDRSVYEFCPVQHPPKDQDTVTTHYDFHSLHDLLVKLDILGHDDPTMIRRLSDLTGVDIADIPLKDARVMSLFSTAETLGIGEDEQANRVGTLGVPEFGTGFVRGMLEDTLPTTFMELVRISGLSHGESVWLGNAQELIREGIAELRDCICTRDDILTTLLRYGLDKKHAFDIMERVRKGKGLVDGDAEAMIDAGVPEWFVESCRKIKYLFPRSHAAAYVTMAVRIAWFKVYHPLAYYAAFFSIRADAFDAACCFGDVEALRRHIRDLAADKAGGKDAKISVLESVLEMKLRGVDFLPVDLHQSHAFEFVIEGDRLRPPLGCLPQLGETAAIALYEAGKAGPYKSIEELRQRSKANTAVISVLREFGCLSGLSETSQTSFLDAFGL